MSATDATKLSASERESLVYSYAALLCFDAGKDVSEKNLEALVKASKNKSSPQWSRVLAKSVKGKDLSGLFSCGGAGESVAAGPAKDAKKEPAKVEAAKPAPKKEEPKVEEEEDFGGMDMFG